MNRKLHNSLMALSTTGLLLVVGLMAATPAASPDDGATSADVAQVRSDAQAKVLIDSRTATVDARAKAFEKEFRDAGDARQAIAATAAFVAEVATEAALAAALAELKADESAARAESSGPHVRRKRHGGRSALALPYFSFARGLRGGDRG